MVRTKPPPVRRAHKKVGAPTLYREEYIPTAYKLALLGLTNEQLAGVFNVSLPSIEKWMRTYPEFKSAIKQGREPADGKVVKRLFERAMGYQYEEITYEKTVVVGEDGEKIPAVKVKTVMKQVLPDTTAQIFWLKNRQPSQWRDRHHTEVTGADGGVIKQEMKVIGQDELRPALEALVTCGAIQFSPN